MRARIITATFAVLFTGVGCYNPTKQCGLDEIDWELLREIPRNRAELIMAASRNEQFADEFFLGNREYWFSKNDHSYMLCRRNSDVPYGRCFSDGWAFDYDGEKWLVRNVWAEICVG